MRKSHKFTIGKDFIGVGIGAVILNKEGKFLLIKRGKDSKNEVGKWGFPGGAMELGESMADTIKREIKEELGISIKPLKTLAPINHRIPNEKQHWVAVPYISQLTKGTPKILEPHKISEMGWFSLKEAQKLKLSLVAKEAFEKVKKDYAELEDYF